ncbi:MAG: uridine kinase, partial [Lentisphaeria bacterium]|nr:uridine kinase [Lentisphaeria bacterium]
RTPERYREPGGNVHYERFAREVLPHLKRPGKFTYRTFDCSTRGYGKHAEVKDSRWRIVEGAYSLHPKFGNYADLKVFYDISPEEQKRRIIRRNGKERYKMFKNRWIPLEENYISSCNVMRRADLVIGRADPER